MASPGNTLHNMHNLTTLIKRLEAATSRLEDMSTIATEAPQTNGVPAATTPAAATAVNPASQSQTGPPPPSAAAVPPVIKTVEPLPDLIEDFDSFIAKTVKKYVNLSDEVGGAVATQASAVLKAFNAQRKFLLITTKAKKPSTSDPVYMELLTPLQEEISVVNKIRDANRGSPVFNHLSTIAEGIQVLAWITLENKPYKHVEDCLGSAQYWGNRVLKEFKDKEPKQIEWIQAYYAIFKDLAEYVKDTFPNGIIWNSQGVNPLDALKSLDTVTAPPPAPPAPAAGGPPPPPPPPPGPPPRFDIVEQPVAPAASTGINAVFSELNKGEAVTKGLRKVKASEMTHKNPSLRAGATVPTRSESSSSIGRAKSPVPGKKPKPESMRTKKPPKKELDGNKWLIENYDNEAEPVVIEASLAHSIMISRCNKVTIMVKGKANAISVDNCVRLSLVIESLVSSVDVIKASNFALQVMGTLPTILMDQVDGAQVYLSKESMNTEVFSSKCSSTNLNVIEGEEDDYKEIALPEQMRTYFGKGGKVVSEIVEHAG
ncbi:MAG: hypothetical protein M1818_000490 [Claussenomyces sp. TS43310]|nr:MAG: hypothetical protein M1818_000490 [Claussenomyces sp. TS43310]